ncbi:MAG: DUF1659 domain-containing protein [Sporomusaceae bacterium]|nr:DUF1659 domain-containing protein [Sporomusaceae bacterium]
MAVNKETQLGKLILKVQTGVNTAGKPVYKQRTLSGLKASAADADVYAVGTALGALQQHTPFVVERLDEGTLSNS